jgi:uncharacterized protein with PIN domain
MGELYQNRAEHTRDEPRLLVDAMLGSLARWLRLLGCDAALASDDEDDARLVRRARAEDRIIVTRDTGLARRRGVPALFITGTELGEQLRQVVERFKIGCDRIGTRCLECNHVLVSLSREAARDRVPPYVWQTQERFHHCPGCGRIYWAGTHWEHMHARLAGLLGQDRPDVP